jgi:anti-sigma factor RsiW
MQSILEQLDNDQAILLMYLADELNPADRIAVEARLATDLNLRVELQELRAMQQSMSQSLEALDASQPLSERFVPAQRNVFRQIKQWHADRLAAVAVAGRDSVRARGRHVRYLIPLATAVVALVGLAVWWGWTIDSQLPPDENFPHLNADLNGPGISWQLDSRDNSLADAERDMDAIADLRSLTQ